MPSLEQISTENVLAFKTVRLWALEDSPSAFGSTYARESAFPDSEWLTRAARMNGETRIGYLAMESGAAYGIAAGFLDEQDPTRAQLVSMWVAPGYRRTGIGNPLVTAIKDWARSRGERTLLLMVTSCNVEAIEFYERNGFSMTGRTEPYPNDPALTEYEMSASIPREDAAALQ
jgi:ribosomal protein S18 acetylase RimI-like enzyme